MYIDTELFLVNFSTEEYACDLVQLVRVDVKGSADFYGTRTFLFLFQFMIRSLMVRYFYINIVGIFKPGLWSDLPIDRFACLTDRQY